MTSDVRSLVLRFFLSSSVLLFLLFTAQTVLAGDKEIKPTPHGAVQVDPELIDQLQRRGTATMLIYLAERADLTPARDMSWDERGTFVLEALTRVADRSQASLRQHLTQQGTSFEAFWIDNVIVVEQGTIALLNQLTGFEEIARIVAEPDARLIDPEPPEDDNSVLAPISSIEQIKAPDVWALGVTGQDTVVGIIDSGTRHTHEALVNQYRGALVGGGFDHNYSWFDFGGSTQPAFPHPHGTHVTGTAVGDGGGDNQIGVAPGAQWISCLGCTSTSCPSTHLLACAQFMAAPTDLSGDNPDPSLRPHVVNNSWGDCAQSYDPWYQGSVDAWIAAGIVPVFSNGNASNCGYSAPPGLNTVGNPGRYGNVLGVGSSGNSNGNYANHSNWGPTDNASPGLPDFPDHQGFPDLKPNIIAPGVSIYSSVASSDTAYGSVGWSGTSMSAPQVSGLVALMWSAAPCLVGDYATTGTIIMQTANPIPYNSGGPNPGPGDVPNYASGWGEIDALGAVSTAMALCGPQGTLAGQVTEVGSGDPVPGVSVVLDNPLPPPDSYQTSTDDDGFYTRSVNALEQPNGTYTATFSKFGYFTQVIEDIEVGEGQTTTLNVMLEAAPNATVSGQVTDGQTGWGLHARIDIGGAPVSSVYTDPVSGAYSLVLPEDFTYEFTVVPLAQGYDSQSRTVGPLSGDQTEDFPLTADTDSCSAPGYSPNLALYEDFDSDDGGFVTEGAGAAPWQWGEPATWPNTCFAGERCWGTNLTGSYNNNTTESIVSPVIDLSGFSPGDEILVRWAQAWHIESASWDQAWAEISVDDGPWDVMWEHTGATTQVGWTQMTYDASAAAGQSIQIRWRMVTDGSVVFNGYYVDALSIGVGCDAEPGALVSGVVSEANSGDPMDGVLVSSDSGGSDITGDSGDPLAPAGFYQLFAPAGSTTITASRAGYQPAVEMLTVSDGQNASLDLTLGAAEISLPASTSLSLQTGTVDAVTVVVSNTGTADADVDLMLEQGSLESFEEAFPPAGWQVIDHGGSCVWQRNDAWPRDNFAGGDGFSAAADSDSCGSGTTMDTSLISPAQDLAGAVAAQLRFIASYRHLGSSSFALDISGDGGTTWDNEFVWTADQSPMGPGVEVTVDLSDYLGSSQVHARFRYTAPSWDWWAQVDDVAFDIGIAWAEPDPASFNLAAGSDQAVDLVVDATGLDPGEYLLHLSALAETPYPTVTMPFHVTVLPSEDIAGISGVVQSLGHCGLEPSPAGGAEAWIQGQFNDYLVTADASGQWTVYVPVEEGPVDITASANDHQDETVSGVTLVGGEVVTVDIGLAVLMGCTSGVLDTSPVELDSGESANRILDLTNTGLIGSSFEADTVDDTVYSLVLTRPERISSGESRSGARVTTAVALPASQRPFEARIRGEAFDVLIVTPDADVSDVQDALAAFPGINPTIFNGDLTTITAADLTPYDVVFTTNNLQWAASGADISVGDALADYIDLGGKVIVNNFAYDWDLWPLAGRFITDGYGPFTLSSSDFSGTVALGDVLIPDHPVMQGVDTVSNSYLWQNPGVASGAERIADWADGNVFVAANENVVAFNILPSNGSGVPGWTGDLDVAYFNAITYLAAGGGEPAAWLSLDPESGVVGAGDGASIQVVFTALPELDDGLYEARIILTVDDGAGQTTLQYPVSMIVGDDLIFRDRFETGSPD